MHSCWLSILLMGHCPPQLQEWGPAAAVCWAPPSCHRAEPAPLHHLPSSLSASGSRSFWAGARSGPPWLRHHCPVESAQAPWHPEAPAALRAGISGGPKAIMRPHCPATDSSGFGDSALPPLVPLQVWGSLFPGCRAGLPRMTSCELMGHPLCLLDLPRRETAQGRAAQGTQENWRRGSQNPAELGLAVGLSSKGSQPASASASLVRWPFPQPPLHPPPRAGLNAATRLPGAPGRGWWRGHTNEASRPGGTQTHVPVQGQAACEMDSVSPCVMDGETGAQTRTAPGPRSQH